MLEQKLNDIILSVEQQINLVKIKIKHNKKDLKKLKNMNKDSVYLDINRIQEDELKLTTEINETKDRLNKLKKVLYRLKVCERILNNEEELFECQSIHNPRRSILDKIDITYFHDISPPFLEKEKR